MASLCFLAPHLRTGSGGAKVIIRLALGLQSKGHTVYVVVPKLVSKLEAALDNKASLKILRVPIITKHTLPMVDCIINFGDGTAAIPIGNTPHVLFLQGFGTQQYERECVNLAYPYDLVITTSQWLAQTATRFGHKNVSIVYPGIDNLFRPLKVPKVGFKTVGTLYHTAAAKNTNVFSAAFGKIYTLCNEEAQALYLSARFPENQLAFDEFSFPYSVLVNPPQRLLPAMYSSCNVWVSPSLNEGLGLTSLEALSCGTPLVSFRNLGLDNFLVDKKNCLLVSDKAELITAVMNIITDSKLANSLAVEGINLAAKFNWDNAIANFEKALATIGVN